MLTEVQKEKTLFELFVFAEWKLEPEQFKNEPPLQLSPKSLFNFFKKGDEWPPDNLKNYMAIELPWHMELSGDGKLVAILQEGILEIIISQDDIMVPVERIKVRKDNFPHQRRLCWCTDNTLLAIGSSQGVIDIYDVLGYHLWTIPPPGNLAMENGKSTNLQKLIAGMEFIYEGNSKQECDPILNVVYSCGNIQTYQLSSNKDLRKADLIKSGISSGMSGISCAVFSQHFNLIFIATTPQTHSKTFENTSFSAGISAWSIEKDIPYYKKVFPTEEELKIVSSSKTHLRNLFSSYKAVEIASKLKISRENHYLASLHVCGTIFIWTIPGLKMYRKWLPGDVEIANSSNKNFGATECIPIDIEWRTDEELIISRKDGTIFLHKIDTFQIIFGPEQAPSNGHPRLTANQAFPGFLALECETISLPTTPQEAMTEEEMSLVNSSADLLQSTMYLLTDLEKYQPKKKSTKIIQHVYKLLGVKNTTPEELFNRKLENNEFEHALLLAKDYNIDTDKVYQKQWKTSFVSANSIELYLVRRLRQNDKISSKPWILNECLHRIPETLDGASALIEYGFKLTSFEEIFKAEIGQMVESLENIKDVKDLTALERLAITTRLVLLDYSEKLRTYKIILGIESDISDKYYSDEFDMFRKQHYVESAIRYARRGNAHAVEILLNTHSKEVIPFWLVILNNFLETIRPKTYCNILPQCDGNGQPVLKNTTIPHNNDWVEHDFFKQLHMKFDINLLIEMYGEPYNEFDEIIFSKWYISRALEIQDRCQIVDHSLQLIQLGKERNIKGLEDLHMDFLTLESLIYDLGIDIDYKQFSELSSLDKALKLMENSTDQDFMFNLMKYIFPFLDRFEQKFPGERVNLLMDFIINISKINLQSSINFFNFLLEGNLKLIGKPETMIVLLKKCVYIYEENDKFSETLNLLDDIINWSHLLSSNLCKTSILEQLDGLRDEVFAADKLQHYGIYMSLGDVHDMKSDPETLKSVIEQMANPGKWDSCSERHKEELITYFQDVLTLQSFSFKALSLDICYEVYIKTLLNSGCLPLIELASEVLCCRQESEPTTQLSYERSVALVLESAKNYYNSSLHHNDNDINIAKFCLFLIKDENEEIEEELDLIRSLRYLADLNVEVIPLQVRDTEDRMKLIERAFKKNKKIYKNPQVIFKLADSLRLFGNDKVKRHSVITIRLAEESFKDKEYLKCSAFCKYLMFYDDSNSWDICFQLGECEEYKDVVVKLDLLLFASIYAPPRFLPGIINTRKKLMMTQFVCKEMAKDDSKSSLLNTNLTTNEIRPECVDGTFLLKSIDESFDIFKYHISEYERPFHLKFNRTDINKNLTEKSYLFYSSIREHGQCSHDNQFPKREDDSIRSSVPLTFIMEMNGHFEDKHLLKEVIIGSCLKYITEDTFLTLGYLLTLTNPEDAEEFFTSIPESPFTFQLAIYYYALCSLRFLDHPVLQTPQEVVSWVHSQNETEVKYWDLIKKHQTNYTHYTHAQQVLNLQCGVNSDRFMKDSDYRMDTILGLAMSTDKLELAIDLACENDLSLAEVAVTHIISLLFAKENAALPKSLNNEKLAKILKKDSECIKMRMISIFPNLDGFNHQMLIMYFTVLEAIDNAPIFSFLPSEHKDLLVKICDLLPDIDYKDLIENCGQLVQIMMEFINQNNFQKLVNIINNILTPENHVLEESEVFLELVVEEFKEQCLSNLLPSDASKAFEHSFKYLPNLKENRLPHLIDRTVCSPNAIQLLDGFYRIQALESLLNWCLQQHGNRNNFDEAVKQIKSHIEYLINIWNPTAQTIEPYNEILIQYLRSIETTGGDVTLLKNILIKSILDTSLTKSDLLILHKATRMEMSLEHIICSLTQKYPSKLDIILNRKSEFENDDSPTDTGNDWEEDIGFSEKEMYSIETSSEESSLYEMSYLIDKSENVSPTGTNYFTFNSALKECKTVPQLSALHSNLHVYYKTNFKDKGKATVNLLETLMPIEDYTKYILCQKIFNEPIMQSEDLTALIMEKYVEDNLFTVWISVCSKLPHLISFAKELLDEIKISHLQKYFQENNISCTKELTMLILKSKKYVELLQNTDAEGNNFPLEIANNLKTYNIAAEAGTLYMHYNNVPSSLKSFNTSLLYNEK